MKIEDGSRVCCLGDSLTHMGFWIYDINGYLADIGSKTRFFNCGVSGKRSWDAPYNLEDEVLRFGPDYVIVMFGANDINQGLYGSKYNDISQKEHDDILQRRKKYEVNMNIICRMLIQRNVKVILMTPTLFDDRERLNETEVMNGASEELKEYSKIIKKIAAEFDTEVIELQERFEFVENLMENDGVRLYADRIHPNETGYKIMASIILKHFEYDINIPTSGYELNNLPFRKTKKNDERFVTESKLRELSLLEFGRYGYESQKKYFLSWEEMAEDQIRRCFENALEPWEEMENCKRHARNFALNRPRKGELIRLIIKQTEEL